MKLSEELRIGNIINGVSLEEDDDGEEQEQYELVKFIGYDPIEEWIWSEQLGGNDGREQYDYFVKEPLSEEWLLRFGFEKTEDLGDMVYYEPKNSGKRRYGVCNNHDAWQFALVAGDDYTSLIYDDECFKYVHQLQNLVFCLTGKELTIQEP